LNDKPATFRFSRSSWHFGKHLWKNRWKDGSSNNKGDKKKPLTKVSPTDRFIPPTIAISIQHRCSEALCRRSNVESMENYGYDPYTVRGLGTILNFIYDQRNKNQ